MHTAELLVPEPSSFEDEITGEKLKKFKSPESDRTTAELIQASSNTLRSEIHKLVNSIWNREHLPQQQD
jgi:hypothetical protein